MAAPEPPPPEGCRPLSALLSGIAQAAFHGNAGITEELLRAQLYPEAPPEEFRALRAKMGGLLQLKEPLVGWSSAQQVSRKRDVTAGTRLRLWLLWWLPVFISLSSSFVIKCTTTLQKNDTFCK